MRLRNTSFLTAVLFAALTLGFSAPAFASGGNADGLGEVLGDIQWGDSRQNVIQKLKSQGMKELREDEKLKRDRVLLQQERKKLMDRLGEAEKSHTRLEGDNTGYEVSVIADEFSSNNGESFIRIKDKVAQRFYFFLSGKFYKLVVAYNPAYIRNVGFESFVGSSVNKYGRPAVAEYDSIRGEDQLAVVQWENPEVILAVKNKKELFNTYTMSFTDRQTLKRLAASGRTVGGSEKDEEDVSAAVRGLMQDGDHNRNANVVDGLVGSTEVSLNEGRPKDDQVRRYTGDGDAVASAEAKKDTPTKAKKKPKKKKKRKKKKSPDFGNLSSDSSDDLIIY